MYISSDVEYNRGSKFESEGLELLCIEIKPFKSNCPLFITGVYRPPDSTVADDQRLENAMERLPY